MRKGKYGGLPMREPETPEEFFSDWETGVEVEVTTSPPHIQFNTTPRWYWCYLHDKIEEGREPTNGCQRYGPWDDKEKVVKWVEKYVSGR